MVKSGGTSIKEQLVLASLAEGHKPPGTSVLRVKTNLSMVINNASASDFNLIIDPYVLSAFPIVSLTRTH